MEEFLLRRGGKEWLAATVRTEEKKIPYVSSAHANHVMYVRIGEIALVIANSITPV